MSVRARHARGEVATSRTGSRSTLLVGRAREQAILTDLLADALDGHGALVLVGGEAGMGKTALVQAMCAEAVDQHCLVLTGACYDDGATPPFGPWRELAANAALRNGHLPGPPPLNQALRPDTFVAELHDYLRAFAERGPLVLVLEDLHWADPESLEFLRLVARQLHDRCVLLVATYRDDDLTHTPALDRVLPQLVRESKAQRIGLHPLDVPAIQALIAARYALPDADLARLAAYLGTAARASRSICWNCCVPLKRSSACDREPLAGRSVRSSVGGAAVDPSGDEDDARLEPIFVECWSSARSSDRTCHCCCGGESAASALALRRSQLSAPWQRICWKRVRWGRAALHPRAGA